MNTAAVAAVAVIFVSLWANTADSLRMGATGPLPATLPVNIAEVTGFVPLRTSGSSTLYQINSTAPTTLPSGYDYAPLLLDLRGTHSQIGYDFANLLAEEASFTYATFLYTLTQNETMMHNLARFNDYLWDTFYAKHIPARFIAELDAMDQWCADAGVRCANLRYTPRVVSQRFFSLANMPADAPNIISALERELERGWPAWLKEIVNDIIAILEKHFIHSCDSYGVWGPRTVGGKLYTSRNLDFNSGTGISNFKLITVYNIRNGAGATVAKYASYGFSFGLGALAGQNAAGVTTSEMNLDNSRTTFSGLPFPLRLRLVLEEAVDLQSAMTTWNATNNTNSFNFLIGSAKDGAAYALETMFNFTAVFPSNSPVEAASTYDCGVPPKVDPTCSKWAGANATGRVKIGFPLPNAVWRTNHGMSPVIMATQEPLFNNTVFRYQLMHDIFAGYASAGALIADVDAVRIVATLGVKGDNYLTCDQVLDGDNILSVAYVPGDGRAFVAWEVGTGSSWRPAACQPYLHIDLNQWWA